MTIGNPDFFKKCRAMSGGDTCKVCGHSYDMHFHGHWKWEEVQETVTIMNKDEQKKFDKAKDTAEREKVFMEALEKQIKAADAAMRDAEKSMLGAIDRIQAQGLTTNYRQLLLTQRVFYKQQKEANPGGPFEAAYKRVFYKQQKEANP